VRETAEISGQNNGNKWKQNESAAIELMHFSGYYFL
jgi:hypothetical protein